MLLRVSNFSHKVTVNIILVVLIANWQYNNIIIVLYMIIK